MRLLVFNVALAVLIVFCEAKATLPESVIQPHALPVGKSQFEFIDRRGDTTRPVTVWMFVPDGCDTSCPVLFVIHGMQRNGQDYLSHRLQFASGRGDRAGKKFIVIAPKFNRRYFPNDEDYNLGRSTVEANPEKWAFAVPDHLFDELRLRFGIKATTYRLFGHSGGGQFVHRLHLFYPQQRPNPIIAANPGRHTQFEWGMAVKSFHFPYNTVGSKTDVSRARDALSRPFVLMLGSVDMDPNDRSLNKSRGAKGQGVFRFARSEAFFENARDVAAALNGEFAWQKLIVNGVAHDAAQMSKAAVEFMDETRK